MKETIEIAITLVRKYEESYHAFRETAINIYCERDRFPYIHITLQELMPEADEMLWDIWDSISGLDEICQW